MRGPQVAHALAGRRGVPAQHLVGRVEHQVLQRPGVRVAAGRREARRDRAQRVGGEEAERWGFFNRLVAPERLLDEANALARDLVAGPTFANGIISPRKSGVRTSTLQPGAWRRIWRITPTNAEAP